MLLLLLGSGCVVELQVHGDLEAAGGDVGVVEDRVGGEGGAEEERGAGEEEEGLQVGAAGGLGESGVERGEGFVLLCEELAWIRVRIVTDVEDHGLLRKPST